MADEAMPYTTYSMLLAHTDFLRERVEALEKALHECEQTMTYLAETVPLIGWTPVRNLDEQFERVRLAGAAARKLLEGK